MNVSKLVIALLSSVLAFSAFSDDSGNSGNSSGSRLDKQSGSHSGHGRTVVKTSRGTTIKHTGGGSTNIGN